jgi:PAS domain S-box-containing protein
MAVIGLDGRWLHANDAWCEMLGYSRPELIGATLAEFMHPDDAREERGLFATDGGAGDRATTERRYLHKDGHAVWVDIGSELISDQSGHPLYVVAHLQDISERRIAEASRRASDRLLHAIIDNTPAVITVKGRDHRYQLVNRQFEEWCGVAGHLVLGCSAEEMPWGSVVPDGRAKDQLVLDGGEPSQEEESMISAGESRVFLTSRFPLLNEQGDITAICTTSTDITERREEERFKHDRLQCSAQVHAALSQDRFVLYGQPIINLASMQVEQAELLLRMRGGPEESELIAPGDFLPAAERFGLIGLIDEWVVERAVQHAGDGHRVEVNLSAKTISDARLVDRIEKAVLDSGAPPGNLIFEITETAVADHLDAAREFAQRLRKLGCAFALDDFGVGHGTFTYLKHLSLDYLKIDLQFVRDLLSDDSDSNVVCAIIGVARQFGIKTIAEGVEDPETLLELARIGVDYAQGYWIGRPKPVAQMWNPTSSK